MESLDRVFSEQESKAYVMALTPNVLSVFENIATTSHKTNRLLSGKGAHLVELLNFLMKMCGVLHKGWKFLRKRLE